MKNVLKKVRIDHWWGSFVSFIMSLVYLYIFIFEIKFDVYSFLLIVCSLLTTMGFVAFGFLLNEIFDIKDDLKAGKPNRLYSTSKSKIISLLITSLALVFLPWLYLPSSPSTWWLIGIEIALFLLYSLPFPKFKKVPVLSTLVDTVYAYIIPPLLAFYTYELFAEKTIETIYIIWLFIWLFFVGFRNIFIHQIDDVSFDRASSFKTLPMIIGVKWSGILMFALIIVEPFVFAFAILDILQIKTVSYIALGILIMISVNSIVTNDEPYKGKYFVVSSFRNLYDPFYQAFWPIILIIGLTVYFDERWLWLLLIHFSLFVRNTHAIFHRIKSWYQWIKSTLNNLFYKIGHYTISRLLLLGGVDLRKKNMTVLEYLEKIIKK